MPFGTRLRELREDHDMTQKTLAGILNISPRMVSFYESGEHFPRDEQILFQLADLFQVSTDYLLGYEGHKQNTKAKKAAHKLHSLPESAQNSALEYIDFLSTKYKKK